MPAAADFPLSVPAGDRVVTAVTVRFFCNGDAAVVGTSSTETREPLGGRRSHA